MTGLMIVESPNKIKKITHYLHEIGLSDIKVAASVGHFRDLPVRELGVDTSSFSLTYIVSPEKESVVAKLKSALVGVNQVYLATDPDREGEAIAWHIYETLNLKKLGIPVVRIKFNEITQSGIQSAIQSQGAIDMHLVAAQEARRAIDRLVGYLVSPRLGNKLSAGRVQSPAVLLVYERDKEITEFKPEIYYEVMANMDEPEPWQAKWISDDYRKENQSHWQDQSIAASIAKVSRLTVMAIEKKQRASKAPSPFTTSLLQQAASVKLKLSPDETMNLAQKLFAGGAITYHRTDSPNFAENTIAQIGLALESMGLPIVNPPNHWKAKGGAQEAHEAIHPIDFSVEIAGETESEQLLYQLIRIRSLACQMPDAIFDVMDVYLEGDVWVPLDGKPAIFKAHGESITAQTGWMTLMGKVFESEDDENQDNQLLPVIKIGDSLTAKGQLFTKQTTPPTRYTEASLIKKLESLEIGRPSTYASILQNIKSRDYVLINKKRQLEITDRGQKLIELLQIGHFSFLQYDWTKSVEKALDQIASSQYRYFDVVSNFFKILEKEIQGMPIPEALKKQIIQGNPCRCGGSIEVSQKTYTCQACQATVWKSISNRQIKEVEALALLNGETLLLTGFISKQNKRFDAQVFVNSEGQVSFKFDQPDEQSASIGQCQCGGDIKTLHNKWSCDGCHSTVWGELHSKKVTEDQALKLFKGQTVALTGLKSKAGKKFDAAANLVEGKVSLSFN